MSIDILESDVKRRAMGLWKLVSMSEPPKVGPRKAERWGRRPRARLAKKRLKALEKAKKISFDDKNGLVHVCSGDVRDYAAARLMIRRHNNKRVRAWEGLSDEEQAEARKQAREDLASFISTKIPTQGFMNLTSFLLEKYRKYLTGGRVAR